MLMAADKSTTDTNNIVKETEFCRRSGADQAWSTVWQRRKLSKQKLRRFFGKSAPVDTSVAEIEKYGLPALLQSNVPLCYFLYSLLEQFSSENLFFYLEAEQFQTHEFHSPEELKRTALQLYRAFIKCNSDFEVNIDGSTRRPIRLAIESSEHHCFDTAKEQIQRLMEPCYLHFIASPIYKQMKKDLEGKLVPYDMKTKERAINVLIEYLDRNMPMKKDEPPTYGKEAEVRRRNKLLRAMIHAFCQTRLHLDFYDTPEGENISMTPEEMLPPKGNSEPEHSSAPAIEKEGDMSQLIKMQIKTGKT